MSRSKELHHRMIQICVTTGSIAKPAVARPIGTRAQSTIKSPRARIDDAQSATIPCLTEKHCIPITGVQVKDGGTDKEENLIHLHQACHQQVHRVGAVLSDKWLEPLDGKTVTSGSEGRGIR